MANSRNCSPRVISCYCGNGTADDEKSNHAEFRREEASERAIFNENFQYNHSSCMLCNGYYGPNFGEPVCSTCHAFIYPDDLICAHPMIIFSEKTDDGDSGNDEPSELWFERRQSHNRAVVPSHQDGNPPPGGPQGPQPPSPGPSSASLSLAKRIEMLSIPHQEGDSVSPGLVATLPPEVLLTLFSYMDDLSLWSCARVCKRWRHLLRSHIPDIKWERDTNRRWPLFRPLHIDNSAHRWFKTYSKLVSSSPCWMCLQQLSTQIQPPGEENMWRRNRLLNELKMFAGGLLSKDQVINVVQIFALSKVCVLIYDEKNAVPHDSARNSFCWWSLICSTDLLALRTDPPEGIEAIPLDKRYCHWQATIMGPADSPYAGGLFYLYLQVPSSYPMCPPVVRFLTRIFHPNVSRHGDVGIDSIHDNWSLVLTISKVLISIQSLLTDPFCEVCMEPEIGKLYQNDRHTFDDIARAWTWRFAMVDAVTEDSDI